MKIQCNVCEAAEAKVLCCADEAALCLACDEKVHAANKLAGKHQRVPLTAAASSQVPKCDICQEAAGYFFCLEDRALLCQECDISIHSMNLHVSAHRRFLLTGVRVGTEPAESTLSFAEQQRSPLVVKSLPKRSSSTTYSGENKETVPSQVGWAGSQADNRAPSTGTLLTGGITDWQFDEFFGADYGHNYGFTVNESSKVRSGPSSVILFLPLIWKSIMENYLMPRIDVLSLKSTDLFLAT
ncbi:unnamed protein product [Spirodela intermedia]|uniref:B box-type domain-containing protein n=2 Tax=Spirodela intermedia TaxID=51605 RepID=A0A7I8JNZ7_SPIIN|nr:unnamed protein product [Spirodela intermedia]CAA6671495.1 unnamed protein product [Spirodela intermedia]CAA7408595.1 unnamed protein product [Spirodela intermedia]